MTRPCASWPASAHDPRPRRTWSPHVVPVCIGRNVMTQNIQRNRPSLAKGSGQSGAEYLDGPVAIIGAGIGGLTAALSLQHFSVPGPGFEQARALRGIAAGV